MYLNVDAAFTDTVRDLLTSLASGADAPQPGGGMQRVLESSGAPSTRAAVGSLAERWFRPVPTDENPEPILNRPDLGDSEKIHATLREHIVGQRRWQELSSNESTFYR